MTMHRALRPFTAIAVAALALAACGNGDTDLPTPEEVAVELMDYAFVGLPGTVEAGTQFSIVNTSEEEAHELVAVRILDEEDRPVAELVQLPPEEIQAVAAGPPVTVLMAAPGGPQIDAVGDGTLFEPGRYAVVCMVPQGADPEEFLRIAQESEGPPDVPGGPPHVALGMFAELTVV